MSATGDFGPDEVAAHVLQLLGRAGRTLATAESLTGGMLAAALTEVPGASAAFRGGVVSYATDVKASVLGVDVGLLDRVGAVDPEVAVAMAGGVRDHLRADVGIATTGVAGPAASDGQPVGTVYVAVVTGGLQRVVRLALDGDRSSIRAATVDAALRLCLEVLRSEQAVG